VNTTQITGAAGAIMDDVAAPGPRLSHDLARAQDTDFFAIDDLLTDQERAIRDRVRAFSDDQLIPVANEYWERAEFPAALVPAYVDLRVAGGAIRGYGCPGMSWPELIREPSGASAISSSRPLRAAASFPQSRRCAAAWVWAWIRPSRA
jgi:hypothetical protein